MQCAAFVQADVFSDSPFGGNPVVVILDAHDMRDAEMLAIARGLSFAETGFIVPPSVDGADVRLRFFTPATEVPFSGHLMLGAAYVLMTQPGGPLEFRPRVLVQTELGILPVDAEIQGSDVRRVTVTENPPGFGDSVEDPLPLAEALRLDPAHITVTGLTPQVVTTTLPTLVVPVASRDDVSGIALNRSALAIACVEVGADVTAVYTLDTLRPENTVFVRVFAPLLGIDEDPASGSANAALAAYLVRYGIVPDAPTMRITAEQGYAVGRPSLILIDVSREGESLQVRVGGRVARAAEGVIYF